MRVKKTIILGVGLLALAACEQQVPNSGQGVGFNDYAQYEIERAQREAALRGAPATAATTPILPPAVGVSTAELAAAGINTGGNSGATTPDGSANVAAAPVGSNPDISDEQNFAAVASRESIESDAERRARQAAAYQLIEVTDLPDRSGNTGPNIVQYALQAPNDRGEPVFTRTGLSSESRFQRNCAAYRSPDDAQRDFLSRGGPQRDRLGLDPDGDGFACGWDPQAFRALAGN
ncbi:MAG: hypothetical protein KJP02_10050 [Octadecabacter sp.]|nr:hypothetical protein [Octadecabacter sp.]